MTGPNVKRALQRAELARLTQEASFPVRQAAARGMIGATLVGAVLGWFAGVLTVWAWLEFGL